MDVNAKKNYPPTEKEKTLYLHTYNAYNIMFFFHLTCIYNNTNIHENNCQTYVKTFVLLFIYITRTFTRINTHTHKLLGEYSSQCNQKDELCTVNTHLRNYGQNSSNFLINTLSVSIKHLF